MVASWTNQQVPYGRRKYLYRLANSGVLHVVRQQQGKVRWQLTNKGRYLLQDDPEFEELMEKGFMKEFWEKYSGQ